MLLWQKQRLIALMRSFAVVIGAVVGLVVGIVVGIAIGLATVSSDSTEGWAAVFDAFIGAWVGAGVGAGAVVGLQALGDRRRAPVPPTSRSERPARPSTPPPGREPTERAAEELRDLAGLPPTKPD